MMATAGLPREIEVVFDRDILNWIEIRAVDNQLNPVILEEKY